MASTFTLRFDEQTKSSLDSLCNDLGMNLTTFFMIYVKQALRENRIPFSVKRDPFYSESNMKAIDESFKQEQRGEYVQMSLEEFKKFMDERSKTNK